MGVSQDDVFYLKPMLDRKGVTKVWIYAQREWSTINLRKNPEGDISVFPLIFDQQNRVYIITRAGDGPDFRSMLRASFGGARAIAPGSNCVCIPGNAV